MKEIVVIKARLRKRDKDIQQAVRGLELAEGEMADMVRDGFRIKLAELGVLGARIKPLAPITPDTAQLIARELMQNFKRS
ncbi:MAG TPA: hypothetical protein DEF42_09575 [Desulfosporosinus sp.]|nr:hypothetical protein [Desulfosporosinus sp.]